MCRSLALSTETFCRIVGRHLFGAQTLACSGILNIESVQNLFHFIFLHNENRWFHLVCFVLSSRVSVTLFSFYLIFVYLVVRGPAGQKCASYLPSFAICHSPIEYSCSCPRIPSFACVCVCRKLDYSITNAKCIRNNSVQSISHLHRNHQMIYDCVLSIIMIYLKRFLCRKL